MNFQTCTTNSISKTTLSELLDISSASADCYYAVRSVFKERYEETCFVIRGPFLSGHDTGIDDEMSTLIHLRNSNAINIIFTRFGDLIRKLKISFGQIELVKAEQITELLNNQCSDTIEDLYLEDCDTNILAHLKRNFTKVFQLEFSSNQNEKFTIDTDGVGLQSIFPNLYALHLGYLSETDWNFIAGSWTSLREFEMKLCKAKWQNQEDTAHVMSFLPYIHQIKYLTLHNTNLYVIDCVNMELLQLYSLKLQGLSEDYLSYQGQPVHFSDLRMLTITIDSDNETPEMIFFHRLEQLTIELTDDQKFTNKWMAFLTHQVNANLSYFSLSAKDIEINDFLNIPNVLNSLKSVRISCPTTFLAEHITTFLAKSQLLDDLDLGIAMNNSEEELLIASMPVTWDLRIFPQENAVGLVRLMVER